MMKISGGVTWCFVALLLALTSVSAVQKTLKSIIGLKKINFGKSVPKHSLLLLHWFANEIDIDNNIIELTFDPNREDYGSHHYGNYEGVLDPLPWGNQHRYYTIGNLNEETSTQLPPYVVDPMIEDMGSNMDRIIFRVREQNTHGRAYQTIDQVYITQHYDTSENQGTLYDPAHTYRITTNLLREIREFAVGEDQLPLSYLRNRFGSSADDFDIENTWGELACLGLLLYIVLQEKQSSKQQHNRPKIDNEPEDIRAESDHTKQNRITPRNEREHNVLRNEREHNVPRNVQNQGYVALNMGDDEDRVTSRGPVNTQSDCCNTFEFCIICCIACIVVFVLGIIIWFFVMKK